MSCIKCGYKLMLAKTWITEIEPDSEPYEADIEEDVDDIELNVCFDLYYCPKCEIIHDIWDDERNHLIGHEYNKGTET